MMTQINEIYMDEFLVKYEKEIISILEKYYWHFNNEETINTITNEIKNYLSTKIDNNRIEINIKEGKININLSNQ